MAVSDVRNVLVANPVMSAVVAVVAFIGGFMLRGVIGGTIGYILMCLGILIAVIAAFAALQGFRRR